MTVDRMARMAARFAIIPAVCILLFSCATGGRIRGETVTPLFYGYGTGATVTRSLNVAKQQILQKVIEIILSAEARSVKATDLDRLFYSNDRLNGYFVRNTLVILAQGKEQDVFFSHIGLRVDLEAVVLTLEANDIYGGLVVPGADIRLEDAPPPDMAQGTRVETQAKDADVVKPGPDPVRNAVVQEYLGSLTFLVYFDDKSRVDPFLMKAAVGIANRYLNENGIQLIDLDTVETVKRDQELAYEAQTGDAVSLIQWIALKLNADIYVEIDAEATGETKDGNFYGQANITLKFFDSSQATLLASVPYRSPRTFSSSSELDALNNAIQSSVYQAMPAALEQVYARVEKNAAEGIPYELIILRPPDSRLMLEFLRELQLRTERVQLVSQSADEVRYRVFLLGAVEDLQDIVFSVSDVMPELRNLELVYLRGKSITFESGL